MTVTVLGFETSCDETAAAVVRRHADGRAEVLASVVGTQVDEHAPFGGVVPEIAARAHVEAIDAVAARAMAEAGVGWAGLDGVAATAGPGLVGGVMVGLSFGKAVALARGLPLLAVNHLEGHAVSARLGAEAPYPFLLLLVSGGHCQLLGVEGVGAFTRYGSTLDDAAGEAFDKTAKALGLGYPGGPALERLAAAAASEDERADLAASVQAAIARQLAERSARAMGLHADRHRDAGRLFVVAGGVAANGTVRRALQALCAERGFTFAAPPLAYCTDNAAMIALAGAERLAVRLTDDLDAPARPRWPLDARAAAERPTHAPGRKGAKA